MANLQLPSDTAQEEQFQKSESHKDLKMDFWRTEMHDLELLLELTLKHIHFLAFSELAKINMKGHTFIT